MPRFISRLAVACAAMAMLISSSLAHADILVTNFYNNQVDRYNEDTLSLVQAGYFTAPTMGFAGLAGIAINPLNNNVYVGGQQDGNIYVFNGLTGAPLASTPTGIPGIFKQLPGTAPARLAIDSSGTLWVGDFGGNGVKSYNTTTGAMIQNVVGAPTQVSGLGFDGSGNLYIGDLNTTVVYKYNIAGSALSFFSSTGLAGPYTPSAMATDTSGNVLISDLGFVTGDGGIFKYTSGGVNTQPGGAPLINVDAFMPPPVGTPASGFTSSAPSGILFDENGDILVAALGPTNPGEGGPDGRILRFSPTGTFLGMSPFRGAFAGLVFAPSAAAVPEPSTLAAFAVCFLALLAGATRMRRK